MSPFAATGPNAEQIEYWNEVAGPRWVEDHELMDRQIGPLGDVAIERAAVAPGDRVLDVGCGCGHTTLALARRIEPGGVITGLDLSAAMLERARQRAAEAGLANARFEQCDVQTVGLPPDSADHVFSRFGVMFFADPTAAFANLAGALRTGGRLTFVCWQALPRNPWLAVPMVAAAQVVEMPPRPDPHAPGPFAFADADRVKGILRDAGFTSIAVEPLELKLTIADGSLEGAMQFVQRIGPLSALLREVDDATKLRALDAVRDALAPFGAGGELAMDAAAWLVAAAAAGPLS